MEGVFFLLYLIHHPQANTHCFPLTFSSTPLLAIERKRPLLPHFNIWNTTLSSRGGPGRRRLVDTARIGVFTPFEALSVHGGIAIFSGCGEALYAIGAGAEMTREG